MNFFRSKLYTSLLLSAVLAVATSCDDYLDVKPKDALSTTEDVIVNKATAESALRGLYSALADAGYYGTSFQSIGYLSGDNVQWTGSQSQVQEFFWQQED